MIFYGQIANSLLLGVRICCRFVCTAHSRARVHCHLNSIQWLNPYQQMSIEFLYRILLARSHQMAIQTTTIITTTTTSQFVQLKSCRQSVVVAKNCQCVLRAPVCHGRSMHATNICIHKRARES